MRGSRLWRAAPWSLALIVLVVMVVVQLQYPGTFGALRNQVFDTYIQWQPRSTQDLPLVVVHIDERSLQQLGPWPWGDALLTRLLAALGQQRSVTPALNLVLDATDGPAADQSLAGQLSAASGVVGIGLTPGLRETWRSYRKAGVVAIGDQQVNLGRTLAGFIPIRVDLAEAAAGIGAVNIFPDADGSIRRFPLLYQIQDELFPSFVAEVLRVTAGSASYVLRQQPGNSPLAFKIGPLVVPLDRQGEFWMHYAHQSDVPVVSAVDVIERSLPDDVLAGRIAIVGVSAAGLGSLTTSPLGEFLSTAEIQAQALGQLLAGVTLSRPDWALGAEVVAGVILAIVILLVSSIWRGAGPVLFGSVAIGMMLYGGWYLFDVHRLLIDPVSPGITMACVFAVATLASYLGTEHERRWIETAFSRYVSANLVQHLVRHPDALSLAGERRDCSFVFTDLEGFTPLVEQCEPEKLVTLLNSYIEGMVAVVFEHQGTVDRIVGDAVAVMFSAPVEQPDHAARAVACALALDSFAQRFARRMQADGLPVGITRIGVHSGSVVVGNFGGENYFDYRAFGDPINTAARLESANRFFGTRICLSGDVVARSGYAPVRPIGNLLLKGKSQVVRAFVPVAAADTTSELYDAYLQALALLESGAYDQAQEAFARLATRYPDDPLSRFHHARLAGGTREQDIRLSGSPHISPVDRGPA